MEKTPQLMHPRKRRKYTPKVICEKGKPLSQRTLKFKTTPDEKGKLPVRRSLDFDSNSPSWDDVDGGARDDAPSVIGRLGEEAVMTINLNNAESHKKPMLVYQRRPRKEPMLVYQRRQGKKPMTFLGERLAEVMDEEKVRWEEEREAFRKKVESFIAKVQCVQGKRSFSPWKGSVVDSVVGAFLTQNVSDHLSSSAFMSLAARFPLPSQGMTDVPNTATESNLAKSSRIIKNNEAKRSRKMHKETPRRKSKGKKINDQIEKMTFDWDSFRKKFCSSMEKERCRNTMDSLDWDAARNATVEEISNTIQIRGMNNRLAQRIKDFLNGLVRDHGSIDLEWLREAPPGKVKDYLSTIYGIGLKSVECVRLLTLHHHAFPVDTNVGRICVRLGWVPLKPLPESLQLHLLEMYPLLPSIQKYLWPRLCKLDQQMLYELHYHMITFGKVFCTKSKPNCNACPLRTECRHFASAFTSARLALPGTEEIDPVNLIVPFSDDKKHRVFLSQERPAMKKCEPIVEEPTTPEPECLEEVLINDIEDAFWMENGDESLPIIHFQSILESKNMDLEKCDLSKALVCPTLEAASISMPKLKNVNRLRTEHCVYELPDSHQLLAGLDRREPDDPCPYLLAIWTTGEFAESNQPPHSDNLSHGGTCCNSRGEEHSEVVKGTLLIPCRTAMRGSFPLNGSYFQVNEVFADHDSSHNPINVPWKLIWYLERRIVYFGTSIPTIFKGLCIEDIQRCFSKDFMCFRYLQNKPIWEANPARGGSCIWRSFKNLQDFLKRALCGRICGYIGDLVSRPNLIRQCDPICGPHIYMYLLKRAHGLVKKKDKIKIFSRP
ncbi:Protein ROS1 [Acorus gramineus]|uniref:Protein ROS1 n=1 Tax=Acorus gramineus TaxID=55184 RepID=A0AAV9A4U1_ACOGR|nr:Protein ROS1 [Acorus gramineus]